MQMSSDNRSGAHVALARYRTRCLKTVRTKIGGACSGDGVMSSREQGVLVAENDVNRAGDLVRLLVAQHDHYNVRLVTP